MPNTSDGTYEACLAYLNAKGYVLWGDYSLNPNTNDDGTPKNRPAALWLEAQVRGVADHYDTPTRKYNLPRTLTNEAPFPAGVIDYGQNAATHEEHVAEQQRFYSGPYSTETRPSALITHGQQSERW